MEEDENSLVGMNDVNSNIVPKETLSDKQKKILILTTCLIIFLIILIIIILILTKKKNNNKKKLTGIIECIYDIDSENDFTNLLNDKFNPPSGINLIIEGNSVKFSKNYKFSKIGENNVTFIINDNIDMKNMFKDISKLYSIKMISEDNLKIISLESTFENCENLEYFEIRGFNTNEIKSLKKAFYLSTNLKNLNFTDFITENVEDMSYMFYGLNVYSLNLTNINTSKVTDMSYMFANSKSLIEIDLSNFNTENVKNMSHMFAYCEGLTSLDLSNFNTKNVIDMSYLFEECILLSSLTFLVSKLVRDNSIKELQLSNIWDIFVTEIVSKLDNVKEDNNMHSSNR